MRPAYVTFFENWLMKHKSPNLLKPLDTTIYQNSQFYYPSESFSFHHFNVRHPVVVHDLSTTLMESLSRALVSLQVPLKAMAFRGTSSSDFRRDVVCGWSLSTTTSRPRTVGRIALAHAKMSPYKVVFQTARKKGENLATTI